MNSINRRLAGTAALLAIPAFIALGLAQDSKADASIANNGPSVSSPAHHDAFPHQSNAPQPGTAVHHHHQHAR